MLTKEGILIAIKDSARKNNGTPLGQEKFAKETGIKSHHWSKYWSKFSDAIREAGFLANNFNSAYDAQFIFEKHITLIRELGHYPTKYELRVKKTNDASYPSSNTFERVGNKQMFANKLLAYAKEK